MNFLKKVSFIHYATTTVYGCGEQISTNKTGVANLEAEPTVEIETAGTVAVPNSIATSESRNVLVNENTLAEKNGHALPTAAIDLEYTFICNHTDGIRILASGSDQIRVGGQITKANGYIESVVVGSTVQLVAISADEWIAVAFSGTWVVETS